MRCKRAPSGLKLVAESWLDVSPPWFLSADAAYGTAFQQYWSLARVGWRFGPRLSLGLEGGALSNEEYNAGRGGGFVTIDLRAVAVTLSGWLKCTAGPASGSAGLIGIAFAEGSTESLRPRGRRAHLDRVHSVSESLPDCPSKNLSEHEDDAMTTAKQTGVHTLPHFLVYAAGRLLR